ncbi:type II toxin-antitoxin system [compost metagenome]
MAKDIDTPTSENMTATEAVANFSAFAKRVAEGPLTITKHGRPLFVALPVAQYEKLIECFMEKHKIEDI